MKKKLTAALFAGTVAFSAVSCDNFLDINTNPNAPEEVAANLYLPPMIHWMVSSPQFDGRFTGRYTQQWTLPGTSLGFLGMPGCNLHIASFDATFAFVGNTNSLTTAFQVPSGVACFVSWTGGAESRPLTGSIHNWRSSALPAP